MTDYFVVRLRGGGQGVGSADGARPRICQKQIPIPHLKHIVFYRCRSGH